MHLSGESLEADFLWQKVTWHPKLSICSLKKIVKTRSADFTTTAFNNLKQDTSGERN